MVIQRWQSVLLLVAAVLMGINCFIPVSVASEAGAAALCAYDFSMLLIINIVTAVLMLISIFLYKDLRKQLQVTAISAVLAVVTIVATMLTVGNIVSFAAINFVGLLLPVAATVLTVVARRCINRDKKLLSSYDRLR
jgi:membrane-associated HD superfamily phosphohydrolase